MGVAHAPAILFAQHVTRVLTGSLMVLMPANVEMDSGTINLRVLVMLAQRGVSGLWIRQLAIQMGVKLHTAGNTNLGPANAKLSIGKTPVPPQVFVISVE